MGGVGGVGGVVGGAVVAVVCNLFAPSFPMNSKKALVSSS